MRQVHANAKKAGVAVLEFVGSVTDESFLDSCAAETAKKWGAPDVAINNAA